MKTTSSSNIPSAAGQLVWCPGDPSLGIGVVLERDGPHVRVSFRRLQEERRYTTRTPEVAIVRYEISRGERVVDQAGKERRVRRLAGFRDDGLATYAMEDGATVAESDLLPSVRDIGAKERLASLNLVHPEVVRARVQGLQLGAFGARPGHAAILGARVQWLPHQIDVATRALGGDPVRMLLADEVGLGKTVEAALIYAGLRHEGRAKRVLVLTPEALCIQWLGELYRKAHELLVLLDGERIDDAMRDFPDLGPFEAHQRVVASVERLCGDPILCEQAAAAPWDLVIVDEAHHLRWRPQDGGNPAYRLVEALAGRSRHVLLLTATPMALDPLEYHALLRLLDPARFDDPAAFEAVAHRAHALRDLASGLARSLQAATPIDDAAAAALAAAVADDPDDQAALGALLACGPDDAPRGGLAEPVFEALRQRHGLTDYVVRNRRGPVGGLPRRLPETCALTPSPAQETLLEIGESVMFDLAESLDDPRLRRRATGELLRALWATPRALADVVRPYSDALAAELAPHVAAVVEAASDADGLPVGDARLRWLVQQVRGLGGGDKLLVFVESAVAVRALRDALQPHLGADLAMFHRELAPRDQDRQVAWFRDPEGPQVMLSTEAGGEGRNFQFCHQVVLYDLPWRPATVEQRIGRVDRVGQKRDVRVLVPYFAGGYEAAVLKIMQQAIGVLDRTVGGIDHALEYVSDRLADLMLGGADAAAWKALFVDTEQLVGRARERIEADVDPILDHASFSPGRAAAVVAAAPSDLTARLEAFVQRYAGHSKLQIHPKGRAAVAVEGAPGAAAGAERNSGYVATFSRLHALDHEDLEFLCFGHPLVEQALDWARDAEEASAALAICRGCSQDGAAFVWCFGLDLPDDVPAAQAYMGAPTYAFALDEAGAQRPELTALLGSLERPLDRMDATPLRGSLDRWRRLVEQNHAAAEALAQGAVQAAVAAACARLDESVGARQRALRRAQARRHLGGPAAAAGQAAQHEAERAALAADEVRLRGALEAAQPRLVAALAVRLVRAKQVSA